MIFYRPEEQSGPGYIEIALTIDGFVQLFLCNTLNS
jgi:hypothetical protein